DECMKGEGPILAVHVRRSVTLDEINSFDTINHWYHAKMFSTRRTDVIYTNETVKLHETARLSRFIPNQDPNKAYFKEIGKLMGKFNVRKIFLTTDHEDTIDEYKRRFGSMLLYTDCWRTPSSGSEKIENPGSHLNRRRNGIEII